MPSAQLSGARAAQLVPGNSLGDHWEIIEFLGKSLNMGG
jgi:hypothetical protein